MDNKRKLSGYAARRKQLLWHRAVHPAPQLAPTSPRRISSISHWSHHPRNQICQLVSNFLFDLTNVDGEAETRSSKYDDVKPKLDTSDTGDIVYIGARPASDIFKLVDKEDDSAIHREYTFHVLSSDFDAKPIMQWLAVSTHAPSF